MRGSVGAHETCRTAEAGCRQQVRSCGLAAAGRRTHDSGAPDAAQRGCFPVQAVSHRLCSPL